MDGAPAGEELTPRQREDARADLLRFTALNALSFEILAGQILILFAREVGASLADIGLLAALLPLASVIQPAIAPLINLYGPRRLMLAGWSARTVVSILLFLVPVAAAAGGASVATQLLLAIMLGFYLCRALGMSSWLPILQEIVLPEDRGLYLSRQEWLRQVSLVLVAAITALYLLGQQGVVRFLHVFGLGVIAAAGSLYFLWRVPDVGLSGEPLDRDYLQRALAPLRDRVFRRYLVFSTLLRALISAYPAFLIIYMRDSLGFTNSGVIAVNTIGYVGAIATLTAWGRWSDRIGAKPGLALSIAGVAVGLVAWSLIGVGPAWQWAAAPVVSLVLGVFMGGLTVTMSRFELSFIPVEGRAHYVAANVTLVGLGSALAAFVAGALLQRLPPGAIDLGWLSTDRYRIFFLLTAALLAAPLILRRPLPEPGSWSVTHLVHSTIRLQRGRLRRIRSRR